MLYQSIYKTLIGFKPYPLYELTMLQDTIIINATAYIEKKLSIEEVYKILKEYLMRNYILKQKVTHESITTLTYSKPLNCWLELNHVRLASGFKDWIIKLWNTTTNQYQTKFTGHNDTILHLIQLNDGRLASGSKDITIQIWNLFSNKCNVTLKHRGAVIF